MKCEKCGKEISDKEMVVINKGLDGKEDKHYHYSCCPRPKEKEKPSIFDIDIPETMD